MPNSQNHTAPSRPPHGVARRPHRPAAATGFALLTLLALPAAAAFADTQITLQNSFIERYKDRATLDATYAVDQAQRRPAPGERGGDLRAAGRAPEIGLPAVAALMDAADQPTAANLLRHAASDGQPVALRGVWRLWCGEGGDLRQVQDRPVTPLASAAPAHVFELHPLLRVGDQDLLASFRPVDDFASPDARQAFQTFEHLPGRITPGSGTTTITTQMAAYDYVEFVIRLDDDPMPLADGVAVAADVLDLGGETLVHARRMIAATGTPPFLRLKALHAGDALHVVGIPRIDLAAVSRRVADSARSSAPLDWSLPYEMVLVAAYSDIPASADLMPAGALRPHPEGTPGNARRPLPDTEADEAPVPPSTTAPAPPLPTEPGPATAPTTPPGEPAAPPAGRTPNSSAPGAEPEVIEVMLQLLIQSLPPDAVRGACIFASGQRSYCASLSGPQCDQLGGAWNSGQDCPTLDKNATPSPQRPSSPPPTSESTSTSEPANNTSAPPDASPNPTDAPPTPPPA